MHDRFISEFEELKHSAEEEIERLKSQLKDADERLRDAVGALRLMKASREKVGVAEHTDNHGETSESKRGSGRKRAPAVVEPIIDMMKDRPTHGFLPAEMTAQLSVRLGQEIKPKTVSNALTRIRRKGQIDKKEGKWYLTQALHHSNKISTEPDDLLDDL